MNVYGYARVSTLMQNLDVQITKIKEYCKYKDFDLIRIYTDKASGKNFERPGFQEMMSMIETKDNPLNIEGIVFYKLDRISRSMSDLINIVQKFKELNVQFISLNESIDTTTKEGRLFYHMFSALAEFERDTIRDRMADGVALARANGVKFGRKAVELPIKEIILQNERMGVPISVLARKHKVCRTTIYNKMQEYEDEQNKIISEGFKDDTQTK
jgi:DNA invertase Pin-like site-specific DNA recombinase